MGMEIKKEIEPEGFCEDMKWSEVWEEKIK